MRIWNTTVPTMKAPLLDYMLTILLIFEKSDVGGEDVSMVERNNVETITFLSSFIRAGVLITGSGMGGCPHKDNIYAETSRFHARERIIY